MALAWKMHFLLPTIIFSCSDRDGGKLKEEMKKKLDLLSRNLWDSFTLESLSLRVILPGGVTSTDQAYRRAEKLIKVGQLSRAYKAIVGDKSRLTPCEDVFNALSEKYPAEGVNCLTNEQLNELNSFRFNEIVQRPSVSVESLGKIVLKGGHMIAHGLDHFRYEHLQKLWGYKDQDSQQHEFRLLYTKLINKLIFHLMFDLCFLLARHLRFPRVIMISDRWERLILIERLLRYAYYN